MFAVVHEDVAASKTPTRINSEGAMISATTGARQASDRLDPTNQRSSSLTPDGFLRPKGP